MNKDSIKKTLKSAGIIAAGVFITVALYAGLTVKRYRFFTDKLEKPVRLVLLTDLHGSYYGKGQSHILSVIGGLNPDAVVMAGDMLDEYISQNGTVTLLSSLAEKYPCYYSIGNHEVKRAKYNKSEADKIKVQLESLGIRVLDGKSAYIYTKSGEKIRICGIDDPDLGKMRFISQLGSIASKIGEKEYTVLLSHKPEYFDIYAKCGFDLVLSGHAHGGQWRLPFVLNGLYAPGQGLFPKYAGGVYEKNGVSMTVSRGLSKKHIVLIPRIFNPPEVVVIDIIPKRKNGRR